MGDKQIVHLFLHCLDKKMRNNNKLCSGFQLKVISTRTQQCHQLSKVIFLQEAHQSHLLHMISRPKRAWSQVQGKVQTNNALRSSSLKSTWQQSGVHPLIYPSGSAALIRGVLKAGLGYCQGVLFIFFCEMFLLKPSFSANEKSSLVQLCLSGTFLRSL